MYLHVKITYSLILCDIKRLHWIIQCHIKPQTLKLGEESKNQDLCESGVFKTVLDEQSEHCWWESTQMTDCPTFCMGDKGPDINTPLVGESSAMSTGKSLMVTENKINIFVSNRLPLQPLLINRSRGMRSHVPVKIL